MIYKAFDKQIAFHKSQAKLRGIFSGKRGGKTEAGAIEAIIHTEQQIGYVNKGIDPYLGVIIAPTDSMLRRLSMAKFLAYAKPFDFSHHQTYQELIWHNGSKIYGVSADKPSRLEGLKANWIWVDEVFQTNEQLFLECLARTADTNGRIWVTGSLGVQYSNPKQHFIYKYFIEKPIQGSEYFEWTTADNPHIPRDELNQLKENLDPRTYRQMFMIDWSVPGTALVYDQFDEGNQTKGYVYNKDLETSVSIDWGYAHPMACLFFQYDKLEDKVYLFDEIVSSRMTLDQLWDRIKSKGYIIDNWFCDIAGTQEREATGRSNVGYFKDKFHVDFKYRSSAINFGIPIVRQYIKNGLGQRKFIIDAQRCPKSIDGILNYSYPEKDGVIVNENPVKKDDDTCDALRYFFVNRLDKEMLKPEMKDFNRFGKWR